MMPAGRALKAQCRAEMEKARDVTPIGDIADAHYRLARLLLAAFRRASPRYDIF